MHMYSDLSPVEYLEYGLHCPDCQCELTQQEIRAGQCFLCKGYKRGGLFASLIGAVLDQRISYYKGQLLEIYGDNAEIEYSSCMNVVGGTQISWFANIVNKRELIKELKDSCKKSKKS